MRNATAILLLVICFCGCSKKPEDAAQAQPPAPDVETPQETVKLPPDPSTPVVTVDDSVLTLGDLGLQVNMQLASHRGRLQAEQLTNFQRRLRAQAIQQFVMKALLVSEADRQGIVVSAEEEAATLEELAQNLPEGTTIEDWLTKSAIGEARMREELRMGIKIDKLIAPHAVEAENVSDADITAFREQQPQQVTKPATIQARHILVRASATDSTEVKAAAKARIDDLRKQIVDGADFATVAKEHSDDTTAVNGGALPQMRRGQTAPAFEAAAFAQEIGVIGPVIETPFGYHIIEVLGRTEETERSPDELKALVSQRKRQHSLLALVEELKSKSSIQYNTELLAPGN